MGVEILFLRNSRGEKWENVTDKSKVSAGCLTLEIRLCFLKGSVMTTGRRSLFFKGGRHGKRHDQGNNVRTCVLEKMGKKQEL